MNRRQVENILEVVKTSTDKSVVVKGLVKLRTDLVKDRDGIVLFREAGGVAIIVRFLRKPHEQILEVVLSILGNCCTDAPSCQQALSYKVFVPLATILKAVANPVIQYRACRLLGNLAKFDREHLLAANCPAFAESICKIFEETSDVQTRILACRAWRNLLTNPDFLNPFLQENGFIILLRILAALMKNNTPQEEELTETTQTPQLSGFKHNVHRERYFEEVALNLENVRSDIFDHVVNKYKPCLGNVYIMPEEQSALELLLEILRVLLVLSGLQLKQAVWEWLNRSGATFAPIVFLASEKNPNRHYALKILANFARSPGAFALLSSTDAIAAAVRLLDADIKLPLNESEKRHCIVIVSLLSSDACNRAKIRCMGALRKIISMFRNSESHTEKTMILNLLHNFLYDSMSMSLMLKEGLLPLLIKELNAYLTSDDDYHKRKREEKKNNNKKRKLPKECDLPACKFVKRHDDPLMDFDSPSCSPRSRHSLSRSPCSSRSISPLGSSGSKLDDGGSDDETYSPVCSDDDDDEASNDGSTSVLAASENETLNSNSVDNSEIMKLLDITCRPDTIDDKHNALDREDDEDDFNQDTHSKLPQLCNQPRSTIDTIESLLYRITLLDNKRIELAMPETLNALIMAINVFGCHNNFSNSLTNIILEGTFFKQVVKQGIPHQLFKLTKCEETHQDDLGFLETLTCVGESNYGKDVLASMLRCLDDTTAYKRAAIAVAYIVKIDRLLYEFLSDGNVLTILLDIILSTRPDPYTLEAVEALTYMCYHTLSIRVPRVDEAQRKETYAQFDEEMLPLPLGTALDMRFLVREVQQDAASNTIAFEFNKQLLCDTSDVFNTMLNSSFREGQEREIQLDTCSVGGLKYFLNLIVRQSQQLQYNIPPPDKHHMLLEAFEMSRIYIIPTMEALLQKLLVALLDETNCLSVLEWALNNYHVELSTTTIDYYLCSALPADVKIALFRCAENSKYAAQWFQQIVDAVMSRCNSTNNGRGHS